jgi:hypothetical protein
MMDIAVWLRSLGLGKHEAAFRQNEIDETILPSLTHETLKELGVTAVGHRVKLLDAITLPIGANETLRTVSAMQRWVKEGHSIAAGPQRRLSGIKDALRCRLRSRLNATANVT